MQQTNGSRRPGAASLVALAISALFVVVLSLFVAGIGQSLALLVAGAFSLALGWRLTRERRGLVQLLVIPIMTLTGLMIGSILYDFARLALR